LDSWDTIATYEGVKLTGASSGDESGIHTGTYEFVFPHVEHCRYYRFTFLETISNKYVVVQEIRLYAAVGSGYSVDTPCGIYNISANRKVFTGLWNTINSTALLYFKPAGTTIRMLLSFDSQSTWVYWNGSAWSTSSLANLWSLSEPGASLSMMPEVFNALTNANYHEAGGFRSGDNTISVAFMLSTSDAGETPSIDTVMFNVTTNQFKQSAFDNDIRTRIINTYQTEIKNMAAETRTYYISLVV
jgi:hypothetical protein